MLSDAMHDQDIRRKRAYYRACHRGTKEMDWLLGRFADAALSGMNEEELAAFEEFLALSDADIDAMLKSAIPPDGRLAAIVNQMRAYHGFQF